MHIENFSLETELESFRVTRQFCFEILSAFCKLLKHFLTNSVLSCWECTWSFSLQTVNCNLYLWIKRFLPNEVLYMCLWNMTQWIHAWCKMVKQYMNIKAKIRHSLPFLSIPLCSLQKSNIKWLISVPQVFPFIGTQAYSSTKYAYFSSLEDLSVSPYIDLSHSF